MPTTPASPSTSIRPYPYWQRILTFLLVTAALIALAMLLDHWAYDHIVNLQANNKDWGRMLRSGGYLPTWLIVGAGIALHGLRPAANRLQKLRRVAPAYLLVLSATLGGALAELLKIIIRRQRPGAVWGPYHFRPWSERTLSSSGLGMPSSHAGVAFGAAWMLCYLYPRAWPIWLALAIGCSMTRVMERAHYLSDVTTGAMVSVAVAWALWRWHVTHQPKEALPQDN